MKLERSPVQVMVEPASLAAMSPRRRSRSFRPSAGQLQLGDAIRAFRGGSDGSTGVYGADAAGDHRCCCRLGTGRRCLLMSDEHLVVLLELTEVIMNHSIGPEANHRCIADMSCPEADAGPGAGSLSEPGTPAALAAQMSAESFDRTTTLMSRGGRGSLDSRRCLGLAVMVLSTFYRHCTVSPAPSVSGAMLHMCCQPSQGSSLLQRRQGGGFSTELCGCIGLRDAYRRAASVDLNAVEGGCLVGPNGIVRTPIGSQSADSLQVGSPLDPKLLRVLLSP